MNSGNADILQSGPIKFGGDTDFDAGSAKIDLFNPTNIWMGVLTFKAGTAMINHPQLMNAVSAGTLIVRVQTTMSTSSSATAKVNASSSSVSVSEGSGNKAAVEVAVERTAAAGQTGLITVAVSAEAAAPGRSFSFALETPAVTGTPAAAAAAAEVKVTQMDGRALPEWLKFDNSTKTFVATNVPAGALPLQLKVGVGSTESVMVIKENQ